MKKKYIKPETQELEIRMERILCVSGEPQEWDWPLN